eukprot:sb/3476825/
MGYGYENRKRISTPSLLFQDQEVQTEEVSGRNGGFVALKCGFSEVEWFKMDAETMDLIPVEDLRKCDGVLVSDLPRFGPGTFCMKVCNTVGPRFTGPRFTGTPIYREDNLPPK